MSITPDVLEQIADELHGIPDNEAKISFPCPTHGAFAASISLTGPEKLEATCADGCETKALWPGLVKESATLARLWAERKANEAKKKRTSPIVSSVFRHGETSSESLRGHTGAGAEAESSGTDEISEKGTKESSEALRRSAGDAVREKDGDANAGVQPQPSDNARAAGVTAGGSANESQEKEEQPKARASGPGAEVKHDNEKSGFSQRPPRPETQERKLDRNPPTPTEEQALAPLFSNVPPQAIDSEKVVLGSIFFRPATIDIVSPIINPTDFLQESHREIYKVMLELAAVGKLARDPEAPIDVLTVKRELEKRHLLEGTGGAEYIGQLAAAMPTAYYAPQHARYVREAALKRDYMRQAGALVQASSNGSTLPELKALAAQILKIEDLSGEDPYIDRHAIDAFEAYKVSRADQRGYSWGGLIRWGTTGLVSALMGSGKTTFSLCLSRAWALGEEFLGKQCATSKTLAVVSPKEYEAWIETVGFWGLEGVIFIVPSHYAHFGNPQKTAEWFVSEMRRCDCRTFVLDTLFDFYGMPPNQSGDENRKVMTEQTPLLEAVRENGWSGLVTGHAPKSEAQTETPRDPEEAFAGHSAWAAQHRMRITIRRRSNDMKTILTGRGGYGDEGILEEKVLLFDKETRLEALGGLFSKKQGEAAWPEVRRVLDALGVSVPISKIVAELQRSEKFVRPGLREGKRLKLVMIEGKGKATRYRLAGPNDNQVPPDEPEQPPAPEDDGENF